MNTSLRNESTLSRVTSKSYILKDLFVKSEGNLNTLNTTEKADASSTLGHGMGEKRNVLSVSALNKMVRSSLEDQFCNLWVQGEISNFTDHQSGHYYFSLKDDKALVPAIMFRGFNQKLKFKPKAGMEVLVYGKVTLYEPKGNYQIFCEVMRPVGVGDLQLAFEQMKEKLSKEGLFLPKHKRPIPELPQRIGVITSPTGAAIKDILNVLSRRFKGLDITIIPTIVQGDTAAENIAQNIQLANEVGEFDVLIAGRGGGSIEDLWAFNEEIVARAIFSSQIPIISAVGHEIDFTISDLVADLRAPTPSAAAELVVKNAQELKQNICLHFKRLKSLQSQILEIKRKDLNSLSKQLIDPQRRVQDLCLRVDEISERLERGIKRSLKTQRDKLSQLGALLDSISPLKVLSRGYCIAQKNKKTIKNAKTLKKGDLISVQFEKGSIKSKVQSIE